MRRARSVKRGRPQALSEAEERLALQLRLERLIPFEREWRFDDRRKWRLDFAWPSCKVAVEVQGWGRHQRFLGFEADCEKLSHAAAAGWQILLVTPRQIKSGAAIEWIRHALRDNS